MDYRTELKNLIEQKDGLILTRDATEVGIPRKYLSLFAKEGILERIAHGVYLSSDAFEDEMYILQSKNTKAVFSHETALYLHGLTDRDPLEYAVTVPAGYNGTKLKDVGVKVYTIKRELHSVGVIAVKTNYGRPILTYDKERTLCDIVRSRNSLDIAIVKEGIKRYISSKDKNIPLLMRYSKMFNIENIIRNYMEILL